MVTAPAVGALADRYGHFRVMLGALLLIGASTYPLFVVLTTWPSVSVFLSIQAVVGLLIAATLGALPMLLADIYPTGTRGIGLAISYNFSVTLFGGFAPLIVTWLIDATDNKLAPSFYVLATTAISVIAIAFLGRRVSAGSKSAQLAQQPL
jgi:MHS family proline/betaine transporter-like MFS transporter